MKLKVLKAFRDKQAFKSRWEGEEFTTTAERGAVLVELGLVEAVEVKEDTAAADRTTKEDKTAKKNK